MWLLIGCLLLFVATSVSVTMLGTQIMDDIERGLPVQERPSWRAWKVRRLPLAEVRRHRQMYPTSRLRKWWAAASITQGALIAVPFVSAIVRTFLKNG